MKKSFTDKILILILIILIFLFAISLFKNISYPLLWNDEAETAMFAERILQHGYPNIYDGKNLIYLSDLPIKYGIKEDSNAYIVTVWGHYYFCTIGNYLAKKVDNIYIKTALLRIPFALVGFIGLIILAITIMKLFKDKTKKLLFLVLFIFLELISISLILHLREVRYYSLMIFLSACIFYLFIKHRIFHRIKNNDYFFFITIFLLLIFHTFLPIYFVFVIVIGLYEFVLLIREKRLHDFFINISPLVVSFVMLIPSLVFFNTFNISKEFVKLFNFNYIVQFKNIIRTFKAFSKYEFLYLILFIKTLIILLWLYLKDIKMDEKKLKASSFLSLFFIIYILVITKMPLPVIYQRYFIILQPILIVILLIDVFIVYELISNINVLKVKRGFSRIALFVITILFLFCVLNKAENIKNHIYEITHRYKGPIDYIIPYIQSTFKNTENLVIATNYEGCSYMYYLGSKVVVGYIGVTFKSMPMPDPDIVILRKRFSYTEKILKNIIRKGKYRKVAFPVYDYPVNNTPELNDPYHPHLFKTKMAKNKNEELVVYIKKQ